MTADITLRGPGDVVAVLPYQLGYHPRHSVVVVALRDRRVGLVVRADLPPVEHAGPTASTLVGPLLRDGATSVIVVGYEDAVDASQPILLAIVEQLERAGVDVVDVAVVRDGRRYSPICAEACCPPEGVPLPSPADVPGVAEYVGLGRSPLGSRAAVHDLVRPEAARCAGVADAVTARASVPRRRRRAAAAWALLLSEDRRAVTAGGLGGVGAVRAAESVADLVLGLADVAWRDGLIAWLAPGVLPTAELDERVVALIESSLPRWGGTGFAPRGPGGAGRTRAPSARARERSAVEREELVQRLLAACRSVPDDCPGEAAAMCTVAAHVAWVCGDGAIARVALERALRLDPDYRLAVLLEGLVDHGLRLPTSRSRRDGRDVIGRVG